MVGWKCCADGKFSVSSAYQVRAGQVAGGEDKGATMWELWRSCNAILFETSIEGYASVVGMSHECVTMMQHALDSKARGAVDATGGAHGLANLIPPDVDGVKLNTDEADRVRRKEGLPILLNLDELRNRAWYVHFEHMHREGKKVANALAKLMNSYFRDMVRCKTSPMVIDCLLQKDTETSE
ncbi:hypothetical protein V6N12_049026 [Hibiscus sabdariffa]|uniref:Uncharacterized protein n=1 Tax=Hibiscus sabdariffa TaxID=183260 RepID=A0ABR2EIZ8_9ROSI